MYLYRKVWRADGCVLPARRTEGHNWWCVLYPNLCFLDTTNAVVPDKGKKQLKQVLTEEEYSKVTANTKFKIGWYFWK